MNRKFAGICTVGLALFAFAVTIRSDEQPPQNDAQAGAKGSPQMAVTEAVKLLVAAVNDYRESNDLKPLTVDQQLNEACEHVNRLMIETGNFSHNVDSTTPSGRVTEAGYEWSFVAENLYYYNIPGSLSDAEQAQKVVNGWKQSPGHNQNLLRAQATQCGVAITTDAKSGRTYVSMVYAAPR